MIKPTVGRVVWYFGSKDLINYDPLAGIVACVHSDDKVNLMVLGPKGECFPRERVRLVQDLEVAKATDNLPDGEFCTWMPFQKAQPQVAQAVEERLKILEAAYAQQAKEVISAHEMIAELTKRLTAVNLPAGVVGSGAVGSGLVEGQKLWVPPGNPGNPLPGLPADNKPVPAPVKQVTK